MKDVQPLSVETAFFDYMKIVMIRMFIVIRIALDLNQVIIAQTIQILLSFPEQLVLHNVTTASLQETRFVTMEIQLVRSNVRVIAQDLNSDGTVP